MFSHLGTARGCGWQKICAYINLASYYLVGIPTSVVLAFVLHVGIQVESSTKFLSFLFNFIIYFFLAQNAISIWLDSF